MLRSQKPVTQLLIAFMCVACLLGAVHPMAMAVEETQVPPQEQTAYTLTTLVRNYAYFSSAVIGQMEDGTEITVLGVSGSFYKVDCYDTTGYIAQSQVLHTDDGKYYVNCKEGSSETGKLEYTEYCEALGIRHGLYELAKKQLGTPYVYGGSRPGGFDCSGLMYYIFGQYGIDLHRTASGQMQDGIIVAKEGLQVGDLIFFREHGETSLCSHVGIYVGNNQIIHSGSPGVEYADLDFDYFDKYYLCARRIINTDAPSTASDLVQTPVALPLTNGRRTR